MAISAHEETSRVSTVAVALLERTLPAGRKFEVRAGRGALEDVDLPEQSEVVAVCWFRRTAIGWGDELRPRPGALGRSLR